MTKKKFSFPCPLCGGELSAEILAQWMPQLRASYNGQLCTADPDRLRAIQKLGQEALRRKRESSTPEEIAARREQCRQAAKIRWAARKAAEQ